jgi:hypothetical protein
VVPGGPAREYPDQEVSDFSVTETDEGHPQWKLYARYAAMYSARNLVQARGVRVDFFDDKGDQSSTLTAREGDINQRTHNMTARGSVVLQTTEGTRLSSEQLGSRTRSRASWFRTISWCAWSARATCSRLRLRERSRAPALRVQAPASQATVRTRSGGTIGPRRSDR